MQTYFTIMGWNLVAVAAMMVTGWLISLAYRNVTVVDSLWGLGFVLIAWLTFFMSDGYAGRKMLIAMLVALWGLRLSLYLTWRNWGKGEDPRYGTWRIKSGERFWLVSLFKVFILQALFLGDWQLAQFKSDPANKGRVMDRGLWAYTRHPNYFGEFLIWWGIFLITLSTPNSWWTIISPIIITAVLLKMTGIPLTEQELIKNRPGYSDYVKRTSAFVPWLPVKEEK